MNNAGSGGMMAGAAGMAGTASMGGSGGSMGDAGPDASDAPDSSTPTPEAGPNDPDAGNLADAAAVADAGDAGPPPTPIAELCTIDCNLQAAFAPACDTFDMGFCLGSCNGLIGINPTCEPEYRTWLECLNTADSWICDGPGGATQPTADATCEAQRVKPFICLAN
jgi:hypothetical protein